MRIYFRGNSIAVAVRIKIEIYILPLFTRKNPASSMYDYYLCHCLFVLIFFFFLSPHSTRSKSLNYMAFFFHLAESAIVGASTNYGDFKMENTVQRVFGDYII